MGYNHNGGGNMVRVIGGARLSPFYNKIEIVYL